MPHPHTTNRPLASTSSGSADVKLYDASGFPIDLGQRIADESVPVVLASDQPPIPVTVGPIVTDPNVNIHGSAGETINVLAGRVLVDGSGVTQPVSAVSWPLPTGASTLAAQTAGNTYLASIDSKLTSPITVQGPLTDAQLRASPVPISGAVTVSNFPAVQPISAASLPLPSNAAQEAGGHLASIDTKLSGPLPVTGPLTDAQLRASAVVVAASSLPLPSGAATAAAQTTGNNSLASIDAGIPAALGQATMANSMPVVLASNQSTVPAGIFAANAAVTNVAVTVLSTTLLAANPNRKGLIIRNAGGNTLYIGFSASTSVLSATRTIGTAVGDETYEFLGPVYTGVISGIRSSGAGDAVITELT